MNYHYFLKETCLVGKFMKNNINQHKSTLLLFTGIFGSGKSPLAYAVEKKLHQLGCKAVVLDGDNILNGLCSDLKFRFSDLSETFRRVGEVGKLFIDTGILVLLYLIAPIKDDRYLLKEKVGTDNFLETFLNCPIKVCEERDIKGLYKDSRSGVILNFTGVESIYEEPLNPNLLIDSSKITIEESVKSVVNLLVSNGVVNEN